MQAADVETQLSELLRTAPEGYLAVYLFGSQARGTAGPASDVDLAFWAREASGPQLSQQPFDYAATLSVALGKEVELVELNRAPPDLVHRVLRDGKLLLERDRAARVVHEVPARQTYLDLLPILRRYRRTTSTDYELVEKKLAFIEACVSDLRRVPATVDKLESDLREQRFALYTLQIAIQAALDVASHIVSDERLGEPNSNAELFLLLRREVALSDELTGKLVRMAGFRNVVP